MYVSGTGTLGDVQILSLVVFYSPNIKVNSAIQCLQLVFLKSKYDESQAVCVHKFTYYGKKQLPVVCKQTRGLSDLGVYHVIILAGIISYIDLFFFLRLVSIYHFSKMFSHTKYINNTKN